MQGYNLKICKNENQIRYTMSLRKRTIFVINSRLIFNSELVTFLFFLVLYIFGDKKFFFYLICLKQLGSGQRLHFLTLDLERCLFEICVDSSSL